MNTFIYALIDPNTNKIRYVGKSNNPNKRLYDHMHSCYLTHTHKNIWLRTLHKENKQPIVKILQEVPLEEWEFFEKYWINTLRNKGEKLTNIDEGGNGLSKHSYNTKDKMKLKHKEFPNYNKCKDKVHVIDRDELYTKYILENLSLNKCALYFNTSKCTIYRNISEYGIKKEEGAWKKQCGHVKNKGKILERNVVLQFDLNNNFIAKYDGIKDAAKNIGIEKSYSHISRCCLGKAKTAYGFIWAYE
jgi:hypothetical protein